jgi:hypothetical protein
MTTKSLFIVLFMLGTVATNAQYVPSTPVDTTGAEKQQLRQIIVKAGGDCSTSAPLSELYAYYRRLMDAKWSAYRPERKQQRQQEESKESLQGSAKTTGPEQQLSQFPQPAPSGFGEDAKRTRQCFPRYQENCRKRGGAAESCQFARRRGCQLEERAGSVKNQAQVSSVYTQNPEGSERTTHCACPAHCFALSGLFDSTNRVINRGCYPRAGAAIQASERRAYLLAEQEQNSPIARIRRRCSYQSRAGRFAAQGWSTRVGTSRSGGIRTASFGSHPERWCCRTADTTHAHCRPV